MNDFKFFNGLSLRLSAWNVNNDIIDCEYCFQFDDDEPQVFADGSNNLTITVTPTTGGYMTFTHGGRSFRIFARERNG